MRRQIAFLVGISFFALVWFLTPQSASVEAAEKDNCLRAMVEERSVWVSELTEGYILDVEKNSEFFGELGFALKHHVARGGHSEFYLSTRLQMLDRVLADAFSSNRPVTICTQEGGPLSYLIKKSPGSDPEHQIDIRHVDRVYISSP